MGKGVKELKWIMGHMITKSIMNKWGTEKWKKEYQNGIYSTCDYKWNYMYNCNCIILVIIHHYFNLKRKTNLPVQVEDILGID